MPCISYGEIHSKYGFEVNPEEHELKCVPETYLETDPRSLLKEGDFVFADTSEDIEGSGNFSYLNSKMPTFAGYHTVITRLQTEDHPRYIAYLFDSLPYRHQIRISVSGVKVFSITQDILKSSCLWLPPENEQEKIVKFLDYKTTKIDLLIEKKKALIEKLNEQRIAVITQAVTKGLDKNAKMKPSGVDWLGDVPEHWGVIKLRFLLSQNFTNGIFKKAVDWGAGTRVVNVFDVYVHNDIVDESSLDRLECNELEKVKYSAKHGDFFLVRSSLKLEGVGKSATVMNPEEDMVFECHLVRGRPDIEKVHPRYLSLFLNSKYAREYFVSRANVVTMATIDQSKFKDIVVSIPDCDEQEKIAKQVDEKLSHIDRMKSSAKEVIDKINEYRTSIITAAVTGKIDVRNIQIPAAEDAA